MEVNDGSFRGTATGTAVRLFSDVLIQRERTKRLLIGAACLLFIVAALVVVFAPPSKQNLAYILGAALIVIALGAIGVTQFKLKALGVTVETGGNVAHAALDESKKSAFASDGTPPIPS